ncbi:unnamed protein product [Kluyveromyces dobzhanskii CBS 2104]|uniref:WGS project CCBQ000000000 data, contig 00106 n=1 Tax=Kluyveromyces dobzhanskii CBS 2104 TaxID=1427455 RepID=A0A0A8L7X5_9SACH|nr:unnamed protein product [Kluyveromyces dobzhanskii CBS 2104]
MSLTAQRLVTISKWNGKVSVLNYLVAASALSVCNEPIDIPKIYHLAMMMSGEPQRSENELLDAANNVIKFCESAEPIDDPARYEKLYKVPTTDQRELTEKFREALLKTSPLSGLPKAINSLRILSSVTPVSLLPPYQHVSKNSTNVHDLFPETKRNVESDIEIERGMKHWNHLYGKVSGRVINNLNRSYPDLWQYTMSHVYGPLLSFSDVLNAEETSLIIISSLVPQDVNPQLWGHLKGAVNVGCSKEAIENARSLSIQIAQWCGVEWKGDVVKL